MRSRLELVFEQQLIDAGIFCEREYRFDAKRKWRFDFAWPSVKFAVEIEGGVFSSGRHTRGVGFSADLEKYNAAARQGWRVFRYTSKHIANNEAIREVFEALGLLAWGTDKMVPGRKLIEAAEARVRELEGYIRARTAPRQGGEPQYDQSDVDAFYLAQRVRELEAERDVLRPPAENYNRTLARAEQAEAENTRLREAVKVRATDWKRAAEEIRTNRGQRTTEKRGYEVLENCAYALEDILAALTADRHEEGE